MLTFCSFSILVIRCNQDQFTFWLHENVEFLLLVVKAYHAGAAEQVRQIRHIPDQSFVSLNVFVNWNY